MSERPAAFRLRPRGRPYDPARPDRRCLSDGTLCITLGSYVPDVCRMIERSASDARLDVHFFARLLWKESLFDASAISPAGAQGIAQFMPETAAIRGLDDPFNPAKAIHASAAYLAHLRDHYGNLGLAAAAYNAGEARVDAFLYRHRRLPLETRRYVYAITGHSGETWRDRPPDRVDLRLARGTSFAEACQALARNRGLDAFTDPSAARSWGVILAAHREVEIVQRRFATLAEQNPIVGQHEGSFPRVKLPGRVHRSYTAQIGVLTRKDGDALCSALRDSGVGCFVMRN